MEINSMTKEIEAAIENLKIWDADEDMDIEYVKSSPLYVILDKIHSFDKEIVGYILYNICVRVIPSWEYNCKDEKLRPSLFAVRDFLLKQKDRDELTEFSIEIKSPKFDCTYSDTSGASGTIYNSIKYLIQGNLLSATYAVSDANIANTGTDFQKWLTQIAIPAAFEKRFCSIEETKQFAYKEYSSIYENLYS